MDTELARRLKNLIRIGTVDEVSLAPRPRCRVLVDGALTGWMQMSMKRAGTTRRWEPLTVGEQVVILSPSGTAEAGVVIPLGLYSNAIAPATHSPDVDETTYPDGAVIRYNHVTGALSATGIQTATVQADTQVTVDCPLTHYTGNIVCDGDVVASGISLINHTHGAVMPGAGSTGAPQ
ncbi:Baseplate assembly protein [Ferriphaselus amnicola]|uniref:Baseplate assembly protein n=1 Tax=Ferriphaselus amnicola TaxID=1188319 RepID=A0A2Z6GCH3_9PROT|nr:phage baseplate assembly protein V [Ferriphaselus amnicola]BBE51140.1 Baseplate assembly protein [Ferriphaselus amnicola]